MAFPYRGSQCPTIPFNGVLIIKKCNILLLYWRVEEIVFIFVILSLNNIVYINYTTCYALIQLD